MSKSNKAVLEHFVRHVRTHKRHLAGLLSLSASGRTMASHDICLSVGALDCLYWQALGMDQQLLAKHIRRFLCNRHHLHQISTWAPATQTGLQAA